jgi:hypothetical protein
MLLVLVAWMIRRILSRDPGFDAFPLALERVFVGLSFLLDIQ